MSELSPNTANLSTNITVTPASNTVSPKNSTPPSPELQHYTINGNSHHRRGSSINSSTGSPSRNRSNSSSANVLTPTPSHHQPAHALTRQRRSSSLIQHLEPDTLDTKIDQALNPNVNANWVHQKGAWVIHVVIIMLIKNHFK